ncbi:ribonuclease III (plasmid) [Legionella adelaidensis]|uniref:Ribonuclease 3 n=1 Tax=Legionella adelaidensis TaxID=45056 RepID=A0A0W0R342_9GAMM|nr:ribonuclease III [Legionella adelaidensis]KTC65485.1 ribonuclease III [Legionella adelaidensis]VEH84694.1 ribonuclease III [Legionella adelaidensis]
MLAQHKFQRLCNHLQYTFKKEAYLKQALTHCSAGEKNYERLEFLGDSILSFVIATALYEKFPQESEGQLSRLRAFLVKGEMLAKIAVEINLGDYLFLGQGELKSGGFRRESILADSLEAIFAAIFLDGGLEEAKKVILHLFASRLANPHLNENLKDAKTQLQEYLQALKHQLPEYNLKNVEGDEHDQVFYVSCEVKSLKVKAEGKGSNRRRAEQEAAQKILKQITHFDKKM